MAKTILTNVKVTYNSVDLSDHVESVEINQEYEVKDLTAMGATGRWNALGLRTDSITINYFQDYAAGKVRATHQPLLGSQTGAALVIIPVNAAVSATNPSYTISAAIFSTYQPLNGEVGEPSMTSITYVPGDGSSIVEATS